MGDRTNPPTTPAEREAKLAQALRANLRRRKTAAKEQAPAAKEKPKS
jgi:hypothetical protein